MYHKGGIVENDTKLKSNKEIDNSKKENEFAIQEILKDDLGREKFQGIERAFIAVLIALCLFFIGRGISLRNDTEITVFKCPSHHKQDSTIKLKRINNFSSDEFEDEIRSLIRKYVQALYPKNEREALEYYKFITRHTVEGNLRSQYLAYIKDFPKIKRQFRQGKIVEFFPVDSSKYQIHKINNELEWVFEIEGYMNNRQDRSRDDRGIVTLRFNVMLGKANSEGSYSGLYVKKYSILHMEDVVAKDIKDVKEN